MKLLHSKSTLEPILAVTACPCANLLGLVTRKAATVYRSTTLTTVCTFYFEAFAHDWDGEHTAGPSDVGDTGVCCCWSPSGRLFTVSLPSGLLLVLDVEGGSLARVLCPGGTPQTCFFPEDHASVKLGTAVASATKGKDAGAAAPRIRTSLPAGLAVCAMSWCAVRSSTSSAAHMRAMHAAALTRCLPVRTGVTAALLDEAAQGASASAAALKSGVAAANPPFANAAMHPSAPLDTGEVVSTVSLLLVLGKDGILRCIVGGLYEVQQWALAPPPHSVLAPSSIDGNDGVDSAGVWRRLSVRDMQVRQCAVMPADGVGQQDWERKGTREEKSNAVACFENLLHGCIGIDASAVAATEHRLYLSAAPFTGATVSSLWQVDLGGRLAVLATPQWLALCYVLEYTRLAREAYEDATQQWMELLHGRLWEHLGLPNAASLLYSAILVQLTSPDPLLLYQYAVQRLVRAEVEKDLEKIVDTLQRITYNVTHVCYRCYEMAMAYVYHVPQVEHAHTGNDDEDGVLDGWSVVAHLGYLRRNCDTFLRQAAKEAECARDLARWILQQSHHWERGFHFKMKMGAAVAAEKKLNAEEEEPRRENSAAATSSPVTPVASPQARSPSPQQPSFVDEVPVSATRQPALLRYLQDIESGTVPTASHSASRMADNAVSKSNQYVSRYAQRCGNSVATEGLLPTSMVTEPSSLADGEAAQLLHCIVGGQADVNKESSRSRNDSNEEEDDGDRQSTDEEEKDGLAEDTTGYYPRLEVGNDDFDFRAGAPRSGPDGWDGAFSTEAARLFMLRTVNAPQGDHALAPLQLRSYRMSNIGSAGSTGTLVGLSTVDVDIAVIASRLNAAKSDEGLLAKSASPQTVGAAFHPCWYGCLADDRHVIVYQPLNFIEERARHGGKGSTTSAAATIPFFVAIVDEDGHLVTSQSEDEEVAEESGVEEEMVEDHDGDGGQRNFITGAPVREALCEVFGMDAVPLRVSMSRGRSFCVVAGITKYVVFSLYDDDD